MNPATNSASSYATAISATVAAAFAGTFTRAFSNSFASTFAPSEAQAPTPPSRGPHTANLPPRQDAGALRLLLVDDCRDNRLLVTAVLARWGIVPTLACNGAQAVILAERQAFDLVLMDMLMPVMDGVVATARIRQGERENPMRQPVPIVAYTSLDLGSDPEQLALVGLNAVLPKPCTSTSLHQCLTRWCPDKFRVA